MVSEEPAKRSVSSGLCAYCGRKLSKASVTQHLKRCPARLEQRPSRRSGRGKTGAFHVVVEGRFAPQYWMHLEVPTNRTLDDLDTVLRREWLECCGHLSEFAVGDARYTSMPDENLFGAWSDAAEEHDMSVRVGAVFSPGLQARYSYDFGSTTELKIRVLAEQPESSSRDIQLMARNDAPELLCSICGKAARHVCTECLWEG
ncbi:MAG: IS1096 element passenger TnpR family protein [Chloroflexota bacterium]